MADDKNHEQEPEDENQDQFDDDDFGLPDLEYDELDDEEDDFDDDIEIPDDFDDDLMGEESMDDDEVDTSEPETPAATSDMDDDEDIEVDLSEMEDVDIEDMDVDDIDDIDISDEELQEELDKLDQEDLEEESDTPEDSPEPEPDDTPEFYEEESFEEFEEKEDVLTDVFGADTPGAGASQSFGKDFKDKLVSGGSTSTYTPPSGSKGARRGFAKIVIIGTLVITAVAIAFYIYYSGSPKPPQEEVVETTPPPVVEETPVENTDPEPAPIEPEPDPTPQPSQVASGEITQFDTRTGKSYIIVASFFDEDLAMDHARDLADQGKSPYIIPPFANYRFYRVAIAEFDSYGAAASSIGNYTSEFGQEIWALKY